MHMTHVKKSLALLMAFVMIFSSMSVAASAFNAQTDGGKALNFEVKFFRKVGDNWVETNRAKPGEAVKTRVYITTNYNAASSNLGIVFDSDLLSVPYTDHSSFSMEKNSEYNDADNEEVTSFSQNKDNHWVTEGLIDSDFFNTHDLITTQLLIRPMGTTERNNVILTDSTNWMIEYDMTVTDGTAANTVGYEGQARVPDELAYTTEHTRNMIIDVPKGEADTNQLYAWGMHLWDATITSVAGTLTTTSNFVLDANGGAFDEEGTTTALVPGIIGKQLTGFGSSKPTKYGYNFMGWTKVPVDKDHIITEAVAEELGLGSDAVGTYLTNAQFDELIIRPENYSEYIYDYEDQTVYAAWTKSANTVEYSFDVYMLKAGGDASNVNDYELKDSIPGTAEIGSTVTMPEFSFIEGFYLNKELSDESIVVSDNSSKLKHYYARNEYTVTYNYEDESEVPQTEKFTVAYGESVPTCGANPRKEGYTFLGWSLNSDNTMKAVPELMPANDLQIYAAFEKNYYTYVFNAESEEGVEGAFSDGTTLKSYTLEHGESLDEIPVPEATGYEFTGWDKDIPNSAEGDITFNATYMIESYEIKFVDGNDVLKTDFKDYGETVTDADMPTGYTTTGWTVDGDTLVTFPYTVTEDVTFIATDAAGYLDAIFRVDGEEYDRIPVRIGSKIPAPENDPVKVGYNFIGWDPDVGGENEPIMDTDGASFDAVFEIKTVTITFETDGGSEVPSITQKYDSDVTAPADPTKAGYTFITWDKEIPSKMPADDMVITAVWTPNTYKVEYKDADGKLYGSENFKFGETIVNISNPTKAGYTFVEWTGLPEDMKMPANNLVATAVWDANEYTITFDSNGGEPETLDPITEDFGTAIEAPIVTLEGSTFLGWALADDESKTIISFPETMPAGNMDLVAVWSTNKHTAIFDAAGGTFADGSSVYKVDNVEFGTAVQAPANPSKDGWNFKGWSPEVSTMPNADITYKAIWERGDIDYTINIVGVNPSTGADITFAPVTGKAAVGDKIEVYLNNSTSDADIKYVYENLAPSDMYVPDPDRCTSTSVVISENGDNTITIYFTIAEVTVTFMANGGQFADGSEKKVLTGAYGTTLTAPDAPTRTGYVFDGWNETVLGTFAEDATYTAKWKKATYNAIFNVAKPDGTTETIEVPYEYGATIEAPDYEAGEGQTFSGWVIPEGTTMGAGDMTFNATLTNDEYTVSYVFTGAVPADAKLPEAETVILNGEVEVAEPDAVDGYTFDGWYIDAATKVEPGDKLTITEPGSIVLRGSWTKNSVDPVYKELTYAYVGDETPANAPELPKAADVEVGTTVTVADVPSVDGYTFDGWYVNDKLTESFVMPNADVTVEGRWIKNAEYSVSYKYVGDETPANAPAVPETKTFMIGSKVEITEIPSLDGYTFNGWYYNGAKYDGVTNTELTMPNHDVVMVGRWTKNVPDSYNVTYSYIGEAPDAAADLLPELKTVKVGETVTVADVPVLEGYTFAGWYLGKEIVTEFTMPANNVTLTGVWTKNAPATYAVTYAYEGTAPAGAPAVPAAENLAEGAAVTVKAIPELEGYEFDGWYYDGTKYDAGETFSMPAKAIELTGKWVEVIPETYSVTYEYKKTVPANAPAVPVDENEYAENDIVTVAAVPTLEGYTFGGWYYNGVKYDGVTNSQFAMPGHDVVLVGEWISTTPDSYIITYSYTGEVPANAPEVPAIATAKDGDQVTVASVPVLEGYTFDGWKLNGTVVTEFTMPAENVTLEGSWTAIEYSLVIDANGGTFADGSQQYTDSIAAGEAINAPADPTKDGFVLDHWTDQNGNKYDELPDKMPAGDTTFTAQWVEAEAPTHTITYYVVKGGNAYAVGTYAEGETMTHPEVGEVNGIVYKGWVDENGNSIPDVMGTTDLVAYAVVDYVKSYKATFIVNGEVYDESEVKVGTPITVPADPTMEGYVFAGWNPSVPTYMPAEDVTFNALFVKAPDPSKNEYTARYVVDGETYGLYVIKEGDAMRVPEDPTKFGFTFAGWEPDVPATMPGHDVEFVAQWEIDKDFVTVVIGGTVIAGGVIAAIAGANAAWITGVSIVGGVLVIAGTAALIKHTHTVTYIVDGEVYKTYKVIEGTKIPVPADPSKEGAEFKGWDPEVPEKMGATDLVFEATWSDSADDDDSNINVDIPETGSAAGIAAFAVISGAAAAAYVVARKKKED